MVESILKSNPCLDGCDFAFGIVDYSKDNDSEYSRTITNEVLSSMNLSISKLFLAVAKGAILNRPTNIDKSAISQQEYCGDIINFKSTSKSFRNKTRVENPKENWAIFKDVHEPIIDRDTWE